MVGTALGASAEVAKVLIGVPHVVAAHCTIGSLEKDAAASSAVAPAASVFGTTAIGDRWVSNESTPTARRDERRRGRTLGMRREVGG